MSLKTMNKPKQQHAVGPEVQKELQYQQWKKLTQEARKAQESIPIWFYLLKVKPNKVNQVWVLT